LFYAGFRFFTALSFRVFTKNFRYFRFNPVLSCVELLALFTFGFPFLFYAGFQFVAALSFRVFYEKTFGFSLLFYSFDFERLLFPALEFSSLITKKLGRLPIRARAFCRAGRHFLSPGVSVLSVYRDACRTTALRGEVVAEKILQHVLRPKPVRTVDAVLDFRPFYRALSQTRFFEDAEVLRHGGFGYRQLGVNFAEIAIPLPRQKFHDGNPRRMRERLGVCGDFFLLRCVSLFFHFLFVNIRTISVPLYRAG